MRGFWIGVLAVLRGRAADPVATDRRLADQAEALDRDLARQPVLAMVASPMARVITRMRAADDEHRAWLAGAPP